MNKAKLLEEIQRRFELEQKGGAVKEPLTFALSRWVDSFSDHIVETIVPGERDEALRLDNFKEGHKGGWNACRQAMLDKYAEMKDL